MDEKERVMTKLTFSMVSSPGVYALLLGSGVSRSANIKTGWQITIDLARQCVLRNGMKSGEELQCLNDEEFEKWYVEEFNRDLRYDELLQSVCETRTERRNLLDSYFEPTDADRENGYKIPQDAHKAIARLVKSGYIKVILTTNFDRLIEQALEEEGVVVHPLYSLSQIKGRELLVHLKSGHCYVVKINGDYRDSNIKNTPDELESLTEHLEPLLEEIFGSFGLIVCGWSADYDTALVREIEKKSSRRYATYWTKFDSELKDKAKELVTHLDADTIQITGADDFFNELCTSVNTLSKFEQSGKVSLDAIIAKVKKNIQANNKIGLYDEINKQLSIFNEEMASDKFESDPNILKECGVNYPISDDFIRERLIDYLELVRPLCTIFSNLLYYQGKDLDSSHITGITGAIEHLSNIRESRHTDDALIQIQIYPALLLQYSVGIVALYREDWSTVRSIAYDVSNSKYGEYYRNILSEKSIIRLTPGTLFDGLELSDQKIIKILDDFRDDLYSILDSFFPNKSQFNDLLQQIEFTFSLCALDQFPITDGFEDVKRRVSVMHNYYCSITIAHEKYCLPHLGDDFVRIFDVLDNLHKNYQEGELEKTIYESFGRLAAVSLLKKEYPFADAQFGFTYGVFHDPSCFDAAYKEYCRHFSD